MMPTTIAPEALMIPIATLIKSLELTISFVVTLISTMAVALATSSAGVRGKILTPIIKF